VIRKKALFFVAALFVVGMMASAAPTFGDMAVVIAKKYFKGAVAADASLEECVAFLNDHGVSFSLFDLVDRDARVLKEDFARVVGQSKLLLLGEATFEGGSVVRPNEASSWVDYCLLNDVDLTQLWNSFSRRVDKSSVPEVEEFYNTLLGVSPTEL
jgi:hypothetical protein